MITAAIIQARMGSSRLPGKVMADLGGIPMLQHVIERVQRASTLDRVIVATTTKPSDDVIADWTYGTGAHVYRAYTEHDVLLRYMQAAQQYAVGLVVRITADCPFIDPAVIDQVVTAIRDSHPPVAFASNVVERTFPTGLDVEAMWRVDLERLETLAREPADREHVFPYAYQHPDLFPRVSVTHAESFSHLRWTVDTVEDLVAARVLLAAAPTHPHHWTELVAVSARGLP